MSRIYNLNKPSTVPKRQISGEIRQQVQCEYYNLLWIYHGSVYSCKVRNQTINKNSNLEFIGHHQEFFTNDDVIGVSFENCSISQVPQGLMKTFPNLKHLEIYNSELTQVTYDMMKEYVKLTNLVLVLNKIPFICSDMLENLRNLEVFSLNHTKVNLIEPNIFDKLPNLKHVDFMGTDYINKCFSFTESGLGNATLEEIKRDLHDRYSPWRKVIEKYKLEKINDDSRIKTELDKAQSVRLSLTQQVGSLTEKTSQKERELNEALKKLAESEKEVNNLKVLKIQSQVECEALKKKVTEVENEKIRMVQEMRVKSEREIQELKRKLIGIDAENKVKNNENHTAKLEINVLRQQVMDISNENKTLKDEKFKIKKEADALRQQIHDTINDKNLKLQEQKLQSDREIEILKIKLSEIDRESRSLDDDKMKAKLEADNLKWKIHKIENENDQLKQKLLLNLKEIDDFKQTIIKISDEKTKVTEELNLLNIQYQQKMQNTDMIDLEQKLSMQMRLTEAAKMKELEQQKNMIAALNQRIFILENENQMLKQENAQNNQKINNLKLKVTETADDMSYENIKLKHEAVIFGDFKTVMDDNDFKDFTIKTEYEEFKAHKFVLAARSPIFARVFKDNIHAECLNLLDISTKIFREILHFIYTDDFPQSTEIDYIELFKASERLKIEKLKMFSVKKLINKITSENAFEILILSNKYGYDELRQKAFEEIKKYFDNEQIDDALATQPDKLKRLVEIKRMKNELMKELENEFTSVLKQN
ncbi:hypothetical protein PVAND_000916 [Polypedilum vanderplanki]|uniref:BTB domain-containing protein n=1 Tax=Polypedilum vanderplanki TaxID=319348 RepID=A0A9J6BLD1_POLVA|nr:hypothetical protein PVAND_000916 [Polypedilum vanderplanki]